MKFSYKEAFSRNLGLLSENEQESLKKFTISIAGMGAVGQAYIISLVRQGFEKFKIADFDKFELKNFNRQYGANLTSIGKEKTSVIKAIALQINPNCKIEVLKDAINESNINKFLSNSDLVLDGLDFFEIEARRLLFSQSHQMRIPAITAGPIGFSTAFLIFMPRSPNFDRYTGIKNSMSYEEKLIRFAAGLAPKMLQRKYMKSVSFKGKKGPSSIAAVNLCAGVVTTNALKILLGKGNVEAVPFFHQFDPMLNKYVKGKILFGHRNPIHKLKIKIALKMMQSGR
ncbi:ThiF family adenylyltransferase [Candidatus Pacearchaeota archaeon]|nr:ThiF family adenylyltransferase [Candidatus Pacearchaeota archaeon]